MISDISYTFYFNILWKTKTIVTFQVIYNNKHP